MAADDTTRVICVQCGVAFDPPQHLSVFCECPRCGSLLEIDASRVAYLAVKARQEKEGEKPE